MADKALREILEDALNAADAGQWNALETFFQREHIPNPDRRNTCIVSRLTQGTDGTMQRVEYHRNIGTLAHWWREVHPAFAE